MREFLRSMQKGWLGVLKHSRLGVFMAAICVVGAVAGHSTAWAQINASKSVMGPQAFRIGKSILFTLHRKVSDSGTDTYVYAYIATCDGKLLSDAFHRLVVPGPSVSLRQQQGDMLNRLKKPVDTAIRLIPSDDPDLGIPRDLLSTALRLCKDALPMPGDVLLPVAQTQERMFSALGARGSRKGTLVDVWSEHEAYKEAPMMVGGAPFVVDGVQIMDRQYTGERTLRRELYNCSNRTRSVSALVTYENGLVVGDTLDRGSKNPEFSALLPNSAGEAVMEFVCKVY